MLRSIEEKKMIHGIPMSKFYNYVGVTRQGFHQSALAYDAREEMMSEISSMTAEYRRRVDCRAGSRSLYYNLNIKQHFGIGISKFEQLMSDYNLTLKPLRVRVVTTKSIEASRNYHNLINGLVIDNINQLVVGDLTYIYLGGKRYFLFCLTDVYSGRIVGHCIHTRMRAVEAMKALNMWVKLRGKNNLKNCIHHTDGGSQYFSGIYLHAVKEGIKAQVSCAKSCLENGYAEQRNGIIKNHLLPTLSNSGPKGVAKGVKTALNNYDLIRKQEGLKWLSPIEFENSLVDTKNRPIRKLFNFAEND